MNKTAQSELRRLFLVDKLPTPLEPGSRHLQILDKYISGTEIRLRRIRDPYTDERTYMLQKQYDATPGAEIKTSEIHLSEGEYNIFDGFPSREIRKNRYFHEFDLVMFTFDVFLGPLQGLKLAQARFERLEDASDFVSPPFTVTEVTNETFFLGENLVRKDYSDVSAEIERIAGSSYRVAAE